jgi:stalled ribosome alternative rescue factor ArfA
VKKKTVKQMFKKSPEELEAYMAFKRKGSRVEAKKGKGSYRRHKKHREKED